MKSCRIGILHNQPIPPGSAFSEASIDVLTQVEAIERALSELEHVSARIPFTGDAEAVVRALAGANAGAVFNLCESIDEDPRYAGHPAAVLELLHMPFTGSPSLALMLTTDKLMTKRILTAEGIPTPACRAYDGREFPDLSVLRYPVLVKPQLQDASIGIDQDSVFRDEAAARDGVREMFDRFGPVLVEEYVSGREFNISLLGFPEPAVLPVAEIVFDEFPAELHRIVGYRAKWDTSSFEYRHTPRIFPDLTGELEEGLRETALACFRLFGLRDYARVDVRLDERGVIQALEVNANPCLSPDAGFAAAARQAGIDYTAMVEKLLECVQKRVNR